MFADDGEVCLQESARGRLWPVGPGRERDNESGGVQLVQHPDEWRGGRRWWVGGGGGYVGYFFFFCLFLKKMIVFIVVMFNYNII